MFSLGWVPPIRNISLKHLKAFISEKIIAKNTEYHI